MSKIGVIQVGVGGMGQTWLKTVAASEEVEHVAWVDVDEQVLEEKCKEYHFSPHHCYASLQEALQKEEADGLINVTPPQYHKAISCAALEAGLHVLSEKPLADSIKSATDIVERAEEAGATLMVAQNYRYRDVTATLRETLASGRYGAPGQVQVNFFKGPHFGGFREKMDYPLIIDMSIHHFDLMRYILDADPKAVSGYSWNPQWSWFAGDASVCLFFEFENALSVVYNGSWCSTGAETSWNGDWRIECEKGVILSHDDTVYAAKTGDSPQSVASKGGKRSNQTYLLHEFYEAVTEGSLPATHGRDNLKSLRMVFGAVEAVRTGKVIEL
ncbi:MAG: Gfo/Idh/MocA family oxidoreductase [Chloroflexota bacterium]|nr:Gfo/Idh/MocA family oxidoreductase [Chloroflexota bacterium]